MRTPTAAQLRFVNQRTRALVRSQRPFLSQFWGYVPPLSPPANTTPPDVTGTPNVGSILSVTNGVWTNNPTSYVRQWLRNGANIVILGTGTTYTLVAADAGTNCSCRVTATNASGSVAAVSNALAIT
jgi:hypothetical protein